MHRLASWRSSVFGSCLHAARCVAAGRTLVDPRTTPALAPLVARRPASLRLTDDVVGRIAVEQALDDPAPDVWGRRLAARLNGAEEAPLAAFADELQAAVRELQPRLTNELAFRVGPLREQWEARGPGLLRRATQLAGLELDATAATAWILHPWIGGFGELYPEEPGIGVEGVLFHPIPELPEILRIAWLLLRRTVAARCAAWFPELTAPAQDALAAAASIGPILAAGRYVELAPPRPHLAELACHHWLAESSALFTDLPLSYSPDATPADAPAWLERLGAAAARARSACESPDARSGET